MRHAFLCFKAIVLVWHLTEEEEEVVMSSPSLPIHRESFLCRANNLVASSSQQSKDSVWHIFVVLTLLRPNCRRSTC